MKMKNKTKLLKADNIKLWKTVAKIEESDELYQK